VKTVALISALLPYLEGHVDIAPILDRGKVSANYFDYQGWAPGPGKIAIFVGLQESTFEGRSEDLDADIAECCLGPKGIDELRADIYAHNVDVFVKSSLLCRPGMTYADGMGKVEESIEKVVDALNASAYIDSDNAIGLFDAVVELVDRASPKDADASGSTCLETLIQVQFRTGENIARCI